MIRAARLFFVPAAVASLSELSTAMVTVCSAVLTCAYLEWVGRGRPRFTLRETVR